VRRCLLSRIAGTDPLTALLSATEAEMPRRRQPVRQDGEGLPAQPTNPAPCQDAFVLVVADPESPPMPNDRVVLANRAQRLQVAQRNYPGSMLSCASGSAIKDNYGWRGSPPLTTRKEARNARNGIWEIVLSYSPRIYRLPAINCPSHRQFSRETPPSAYSDAEGRALTAPRVGDCIRTPNLAYSIWQ
jgi:hypothetical protein